MERVEVEGWDAFVALQPCGAWCIAAGSIVLSVGLERVHLTRAQATQLRDALTAFIEEGA